MLEKQKDKKNVKEVKQREKKSFYVNFITFFALFSKTTAWRISIHMVHGGAYGHNKTLVDRLSNNIRHHREFKSLTTLICLAIPSCSNAQRRKE